MRKNQGKKLLAVAAAGIMAVSLVTGCSSGTGSKEDKSSKGTEQAADKTGKPDTWIADRTITIQAYVDDIGDNLPKDFNNTETMKKITELTGIKLDVRYTPGDSDAKVLASQLASGTIPDVIISYLDNSTRPEFPLLLKAAKEDMFTDVSGYMKNSKIYSKYYEPDYLPYDTYQNIVFRKDLGGVYLWQMNIDSEDDSMKWLPNEEARGGLYIQKRIADQLGIDVKKINTQEQFYNLLKQIKAAGFKDDNGNPVYPLGPKYWGGSADTLPYIVPGFNWGVSDGYNLDTDGTVKHEAEKDSIYDEIGYIRKLINEGLMNPEFFTMDSTRAQEVSKNHNSAIIADIHNYEPLVYQTDDWIPLGPLNDIQGDNKRVTHGKTGRGCMAISAKADHPEQIFQFFDWLSTVQGQTIAQYGAEGESYDMVNGKPVLKPEVLKELNDGNTDYLINTVGSAFGGIGNYFFEFVLTDKNNMVNFGEARPGAASSDTFKHSIEISTDYPLVMKMVPGLDATAYMTAPGLEDVKTQMDLLNWKDTLVQAFYAKTDDDVKKIIESFRAQLKSAGVEKFENYVKDVYDKDTKSVNFYH